MPIGRAGRSTIVCSAHNQTETTQHRGTAMDRNFIDELMISLSNFVVNISLATSFTFHNMHACVSLTSDS